jgi:hypothetical protein
LNLVEVLVEVAEEAVVELEVDLVKKKNQKIAYTTQQYLYECQIGGGRGGSRGGGRGGFGTMK